jgi:glycosyltransferase involved in cell wall biosynthesis
MNLLYQLQKLRSCRGLTLYKAMQVNLHAKLMQSTDFIENINYTAVNRRIRIVKADDMQRDGHAPKVAFLQDLLIFTAHYLKMPYFSVVIPLYNKESFVSHAIESVLMQTFTDFELIVVDDASTDKSVQFAESFPDSRLRVVHHPHNKGLSAARNTGIANATSTFITFLDADDYWKPGFLQAMQNLTAQYPAAGIFASGYLEEKHGKLIAPKVNLKLLPGQQTLIEDFFQANLYQPIYWFGSVVVKKEVFAQVGGFDTAITFGEDTDFNIRANTHFRLAYLNSPLAVYRMDSENQITRSDFVYKRLTDFDKYETLAKPSVKKFLDVNRYFLAMNYRLAGADHKAKELINAIDRGNLTLTQKLMLTLPLPVIRMIRGLKSAILKKGIRLTTFS